MYTSIFNFSFFCFIQFILTFLCLFTYILATQYDIEYFGKKNEKAIPSFTINSI